MCVTNTTSLRPQPVAFNPSQVQVCQSSLTKRLLGNFQPPGAPLEAPVLLSSTVSTGAYVLPTVSTAPAQNPRPKRRRKPQKPGKTAKNNDRHFVVHNYHDHSFDSEADVEHEHEHELHSRRRGGVSIAFPIKLHAVLDQVEADGLAHVISWQAHGRCFLIHDPKEFVDHVMPKYFRQSKLTSFQRQLNLYGFQRLTRGADAGGYYHELFLRNRVFLAKRMERTKVKGTRFKAASSPDSEPDFYSMPPVPPQVSSDEEGSHGSATAATADTFASAPVAMDPLPLQFRAAPAPVVPYYAASAMPQSIAAAATPRAAFQPPLPPQQKTVLQPKPAPPADRVLDEAVDELFLTGDDTLAEFCFDWDPTGTGMPLEDDTQLGYMLEKLLED